MTTTSAPDERPSVAMSEEAYGTLRASAALWAGTSVLITNQRGQLLLQRVSYRPTRLLPGGGFRLGVFDTPVLTQDVTAALKRGQPSLILAGMRHGTLRGFIPRYVWAEVPRILADRKREGGTFDLARAEKLWWEQYAPLLHVVCVDGLPMTAAADKLAHEDLGDIGSLQLAGVLGPVVLLAADRDLIRQGVAVPNREAIRGVLGRTGKAEAGIQGNTTTVLGAGYGLAGAVRLARAHPLAAEVVVAAASTYAYLNRSRLPSDTRAKLARFGTEAFKILGEPFVQHEVHGRDWTQAQRGTARDDVLSQVARLLARARSNFSVSGQRCRPRSRHT